MTETSSAIALPNVDQKVATHGCSGTFYTGVEARVLRADGTEADFGEFGELWVKSPSNASGYLNNEAA